MADNSDEVDLELVKSQAFCCSVKLWIRQFRPEGPMTNPRQFDPKNVSRLLQIFKLEGCLRLTSEHHVPVIIRRQQLDDALRADRKSIEDLRSAQEPFLLSLCTNVTYLHGGHRLEAGNNFLNPDDRWWVADLYLEERKHSRLQLAQVSHPSLGVNEQTKRAIREAYSNTSNFCDGDIFRHARQCSLAGDSIHEQSWLARLSESKRRDLLQLQRLAARDQQMQKLRDMLDSLVPFTGLWPALRIGTFHRVLTLRCPEELTQYLERVRATWDYILGGKATMFRYLDSHTVTIIEGKNVYYSSDDFRRIKDLLLHREIFSSEAFNEQRSSILSRLQSVKHIIPSLHTFLEDTKYLEPCAKIMKSILPVRFKGSIRQAFTHQHNGCLDWSEQCSENTQIPRSSNSGFQARWHSYRQLWLFAWRHFPVMTGQAPRKDARKAQQENGNELQCGWWHEFLSLASACGYGSLRNMYPDADEMTVREFLRNARPPQFYRLDEDHLKDKIRDVRAVLANIQRRPSENVTPQLSSNYQSCGPDIAFRCGRPFERSFKDDAP